MMTDNVDHNVDIPGGPDHEVVVMFARHPPLGQVQGELRVLLELLPQLGLGHDLVPELGEEVHCGQHLLGLLLPDRLDGARHEFWKKKEMLLFGLK